MIALLGGYAVQGAPRRRRRHISKYIVNNIEDSPSPSAGGFGALRVRHRVRMVTLVSKTAAELEKHVNKE